MKNKIIYIEDDSNDSKKYKKFLESKELNNIKFEVTVLNAQKLEISKGFSSLKDNKPDLFLVDLDLSKPMGDISYGLSGAATSTALRETFMDVPIIILTTKDIIRNTFPAIKQTISGVDEIIFKHDLRKDPLKFAAFFDSLIKGYREIRETKPKKLSDLLILLKASNVALDSLKLAEPPSINEGLVPNYLIADWIRNSILKYPGILYDPVHSATFLGISEKAFMSESVQKFFEDAQYNGVFKPIDARWWKSKLNILATTIMNDSEKDAPLKDGFSLAWDRSNDGNIERSKCVFSCKTPAEWVCCILNKPMMIEYSLSYRADARPKVMDEARISYRAIKTSNDFKEELLADPSSSKMLKDIKKLSLKRC